MHSAAQRVAHLALEEVEARDGVAGQLRLHRLAHVACDVLRDVLAQQRLDILRLVLAPHKHAVRAINATGGAQLVQEERLRTLAGVDGGVVGLLWDINRDCARAAA